MIGLDDEAIAKMNSYIELNYGRSYLTPLEAERINHQICTGAHADCTLYFTDGILANMVKVNAQSEYARRTKEVNWRVYEQNRRMAKQNIDMLTNVLKRALVARNEKKKPMWENLVESCQIASGISDGQRTENCFCRRAGVIIPILWLKC